MITPFDLVTAHLRVGDDPQDAQLIQLYQDAAERQVATFLGRRLYSVGPLPSDAPEGAIVVGPDIQAAILILTGQLYDQRDGTGDAGVYDLPLTVRALLAPYRRWARLSFAASATEVGR